MQDESRSDQRKSTPVGDAMSSKIVQAYSQYESEQPEHWYCIICSLIYGYKSYVAFVLLIMENVWHKVKWKQVSAVIISLSASSGCLGIDVKTVERRVLVLESSNILSWPIINRGQCCWNRLGINARHGKPEDKICHFVLVIPDRQRYEPCAPPRPLTYVSIVFIQQTNVEW